MSNFNLNWFGDQVKRQIAEAAADGLTDGAEELLRHANTSVPHDEGELERSGNTDVDRNGLVASVYYDQPYAARLHENPDYEFQKGRRGKWLELAQQERSDAIRDHIANKIRGAF